MHVAAESHISEEIIYEWYIWSVLEQAGEKQSWIDVNSPLFSSCAPGSVRYCLETWTQWQGWARERASGEGDRLKLWCQCILLSLLYLIQRRNAVAHHQTQSNLSLGTARHGSAGVNRKQDYFGLTRFWALLSDGRYVMIFASYESISF